MPFVIIIVVNFLAYRRLLDFGLVMDDFQWWTKKKANGLKSLRSSRSLADLKVWFDDRFYSWTTLGFDVRLAHVSTLCLHTLTCMLMYLALGHNEVSLVASLLYSVNPINNQTSMWLNGRRYLLNVILVLTMICFPLLALVVYPVTGLLQVTAFFSPVLLIGHSPWYLLLIPAVLLAGWKRISAKCRSRAESMADGDLKSLKWTRGIVVVKTFGFFFRKMLVPGVCAMQYPDRAKWGLTKEGNDEAYRIDGSFAVGIISVGAIVFCFYNVPGNFRPMIVFMSLAILQWSAVMPVTQILSDRYCSLPNVFMMFFVSYFLHMTGWFYLPAVTVLAGYYLLCLSEVMPMYEDLTQWYSYHFRHFPGLSWYRHNLVCDLMNEKRLQDARREVIEGLIHDRRDFRLLMWGAVISAQGGDLKTADKFLEEAANNFYLNKEEDQAKEIENLKSQIEKLRPIYRKAEKLTGKERAEFMRKHGIRV